MVNDKPNMNIENGKDFSTIHFEFKSSPYVVESGECPNCGRKMYRARAAIEKFGDETPAGCPYCGYREDYKHTVDEQEQQLTAKALQSTAYGYLYKNSIFGDEHVITHSFANFMPNTPERMAAGKHARKIEKAITDGHYIHGCFTGSSGTGKTHLAMGIIYEFMRHKSYRPHCQFINWNEYVSLNYQYTSGNDQMIGNKINNANFCSKKADLLVLDDIGMEKSSAYTLALLAKFAEYRASKSLIVTTNKSIGELKDFYSDNVISRIFAHSQGYTFEMGDIPDFRITT